MAALPPWLQLQLQLQQPCGLIVALAQQHLQVSAVNDAGCCVRGFM
jgi:hypothetical protein